MFEQTFKNIDDILHKDAGCTSELDYTEQSSWLLFLKYLDALEMDKAAEAELEGKRYTFILDAPYRWEAWAASRTPDGKLDHGLNGPGSNCLATRCPYMSLTAKYRKFRRSHGCQLTTNRQSVTFDDA